MTEQIEALMRQGHWEQARKESEVLLAEHPTHARLHGLLGLCYYRLGNYEAATGPLRQATILEEDFVDAGVKLVQALDRLQRYEEALELAERFAKVDPNNRTLHRLINGLRRQVPEKITDNWQLSVHLDRYEIHMAGEPD